MTKPLQDGIVRIIIFQEARYWLAQGLEFDIGAQGNTLADLMDRLALAIAAEDDLTALPPAPPYFQTLWPARSGMFQPKQTLRCAKAPHLSIVCGMAV